MLELGYKSKKEFLIYICYAKGFAMKNHKFNNFSLVLASFLFAVGGVSALNAASYITEANKTINVDGDKKHLGNGETENSNITISASAGTGSIIFDKPVFGGYSDSKNVLNNKITITGNIDKTGKNIEAARLGTTVSDVKANNNSVFFDNATYTGSAWAGRAGKEGTTGKNTTANYNTTVVNKSTVNIRTGNLRGAITYGVASVADYNTLHVKDSTIYGDGEQFKITGAFSQTDEGEEQANVHFNQIIFENSYAYYDSNKNSTTRNLFGGAARQGEANNNRAYISDFNKGVDDNIVKTNIYGGATWRGNSGGAEENIAVIAKGSKVANVYGGAVGIGNGNATGKSNGANNNLVILDLSGNGKVTKNVYGGYISDTTNASTTGNAVYFLNGNVAGAIIGGNAKEKVKNTGNTLILGNDTSTWGERKAGQISNFENLNFNVLKEGDRDGAVLTLTGDSSSLEGVSVKFLSSDGKISDMRGNGATQALSGVTYDKYTAKKTTTIKVVKTIDKDSVKTETTNGFEYNIGRDYYFTLGDDINLENLEKKYYYLIKGTNKLTDWKNMGNYNNSIGGAGKEVTHWDGKIGYVIDAYQTNQDYLIDNASTFTRNIRGMFVSKDEKDLYITSNSDIKENIGTKIGGDDFFTKFGQDKKSGNTITISPNGDLDLGTVTFDGGTGKNNTLNVGKDENNPTSMNTITIKDVTKFDTINFYLPDPKNGDVAIKIAGGSNTDVSMSNINVYIDDVSKFTGGKIHLLKADNGQVISDPNSVKVKAQIGAIATAETNSLDLVYRSSPGGTSTNDQTKIFNEARLGGLGALWQGQYLIANHLDRVIPDAFSELFPYAITEGYDKRFNTGSHVDTRGFNANAGFASKGTNSSGEFTMGPFLDYGFSNYDAYLDDGTHGDGKNYYIGGGFFGKQENNSGSYFEATFRVGQLVTEFNGDLTLNGVSKNYDFDLKSTYYAFHAGLGKVYDLNANNNLDIYGRFFYTHIESADTTLNGTKTEFDAVQSKKIRLGFKDDYKFNENHAIYAGAAYEYEFDSKAGGRVLVLGSNAEMKQPSLRGSTGIGEIGYQYKKDETLKFDVGVKGYVGKQEGASAQMAISIAF